MSTVLPIQPNARYRIYTASSGQTTFSVPFPFQSALDVKVYAEVDDNWVIINSGYSISGAENPSGGTLLFSVGRTAGERILVLGDAVLERLLSVVRDGRFASKAIDDDIDRFTLIAQELDRDRKRAIKAELGQSGLTVAAGIADGQTLIKAGKRLVPGPSAELMEAIPSYAEASEQNSLQTASDRIQTGLDRVQTNLDRSATRTYLTQAEVAAEAAGAPLEDALPSPIPADGTRALVKVDAGVQYWKVISGAWVHRGWVGKIDFRTVSELDSFAGTLGPETTTFSVGEFLCEVGTAGDFHWQTAEGNFVKVVPIDGKFPLSAFKPISEIDDYAPTLQTALSLAAAAGLEVLGEKGRTYLLTSALSWAAGRLDLNGATLKRPASASAIKLSMAGTGTEDVEICNGNIIDEASTGTLFDKFDGIGSLKLTNLNITSDLEVFEADGASSVLVRDCTFSSFAIATTCPLNFNECADIRVLDSTFSGTHNCLKAESNTGVTRRTFVRGNTVIDTLDTAFHCRLVGSTSTGVRTEVSYIGNILSNIGKAALKLEAISTTPGGVIRSAVFANNIVRGFGMTVDSGAIHVNAGGSGAIIQDVSITGNVIDGRNYDGDISTLTGDNHGIVVRNAARVSSVGNTITHCADAGELYTYVESLLASNEVSSCCQNPSTADGGNIDLFVVDKFNISTTSNDAQSSKSGIFLRRARNGTLSGVFADNGAYGIELDNSGGSGVWNDFVAINGAVMTGNTTAPVKHAAGVNIQEANCIDDSGQRGNGTTARRDALGLGVAGRNAGFVYHNTDTGYVEVYDGAAWLSQQPLVIPSYSNANLSSAAHAVNTTNKRTGLTVWNTVTETLYRADGATPTSIWKAIDKAQSNITPV